MLVEAMAKAKDELERERPNPVPVLRAPYEPGRLRIGWTSEVQLKFQLDERGGVIGGGVEGPAGEK